MDYVGVRLIAIRSWEVSEEDEKVKMDPEYVALECGEGRTNEGVFPRGYVAMSPGDKGRR